MLIATAERLFHEHGFAATGMDTIAQAAKMSSRTLYKHAGSKTALMVKVLAERDRRFFSLAATPTVQALFDALESWVRTEGARGCLFLRAMGETGGAQPEIVAAVQAHKARLRRHIAQSVLAEAGHPDEQLAQRILLLFEGAVAASVYQGSIAIGTAAAAAAHFLADTRQP